MVLPPPAGRQRSAEGAMSRRRGSGGSG